MSFILRDVEVSKHSEGHYYVVTGKITNRTIKFYKAAAFRLALFTSTRLLAVVTFTLGSFAPGQERIFEARIDGLEPTAIFPEIKKYEINIEQSF